LFFTKLVFRLFFEIKLGNGLSHVWNRQEKVAKGGKRLFLMIRFEIVRARKLTWDVIPLSWRSFIKFSLEMASISFAVGPLMVFLRTNSFADTVMATMVCLPLFVVSLVVMWIFEKEMYEVLRGMRKGKMWLNLR